MLAPTTVSRSAAKRDHQGLVVDLTLSPSSASRWQCYEKLLYRDWIRPIVQPRCSVVDWIEGVSDAWSDRSRITPWLWRCTSARSIVHPPRRHVSACVERYCVWVSNFHAKRRWLDQSRRQFPFKQLNNQVGTWGQTHEKRLLHCVCF